AVEEAGIRRDGPGDLRLLEHHFADKDAIRIPCAPPGKIATGAPVPAEDPGAEQRGGWGAWGPDSPGVGRQSPLSLLVQFGAQNSTPGCVLRALGLQRFSFADTRPKVR